MVGVVIWMFSSRLNHKLCCIETATYIILIGCNHGGIRLTGSNTTMQGRVELCYDGVWGTICSDYWEVQEAMVACRQLGFSSAGEKAEREGGREEGREGSLSSSPFSFCLLCFHFNCCYLLSLLLCTSLSVCFFLFHTVPTCVPSCYQAGRHENLGHIILYITYVHENNEVLFKKRGREGGRVSERVLALYM